MHLPGPGEFMQQPLQISATPGALAQVISPKLQSQLQAADSTEASLQEWAGVCSAKEHNCSFCQPQCSTCDLPTLKSHTHPPRVLYIIMKNSKPPGGTFKLLGVFTPSNKFKVCTMEKKPCKPPQGLPAYQHHNS